MGRREVTMRDVAERAGVAVSTVSRVVSQPRRISAQTRQSVQAAMRELGYPTSGRRPSATPGVAGTVATLVPDTTNAFFFEIIRGVQARLKASGFVQVLIDTEESADIEAASLDLLRTSVVGAVLTAPRMSDDAIQAAGQHIPLVTINRTVPGIPSVNIDSRTAVKQAVEHLASLGHRHVCYIAGPETSWADGERWRGCSEAGAQLGLNVVRVGPYVANITAGTAAADAMLNTGATAAIAFNDLLAIGMLQRFAARHIAVPDDVSLVGCDDTFGSAFTHPPLTTLTAPIAQAGQMATTLLLEQLGIADLSANGSTTLPAHLTIRASTGSAPT